MAETNWVSLQFDRHIQREKNKVCRGKHRNTRKKLLEAFQSPCNGCLVKSNITNIFKTTEEISKISKEGCNIIGNPTLKETKHKDIYLNTFYCVSRP